jgi:uncharacterized protein DUF1206
MTTADMGRAVDQARAELSHAIHKASPFVEKFARLGYACKGVIYALVGALAAMSALGRGGETTGTRGAMGHILNQPLGVVLLFIVALGLACYALWQFIRAVEDPENEGSDGTAIAKRIGFFGSGVIHAMLVVYAAHLLLGTAGAHGGDDAKAQSWSATLMAYPLGRVALALIGAGIAAYGLYQLYRSYVAKLDKQLVLERLGATARRVVVGVCRFGQAARGVVFGTIGVFLILAAWHYNPSEARGIGGALAALRDQPFGPWLLCAVALGLVAYGVFQFVKARYRRIET